MAVPEGAQRSPDGYYWLDENNQWQPVPSDDPSYGNTGTLPGGDGGGGTLQGGDGGGGTLQGGDGGGNTGGGDAGTALIVFVDVDLGNSNVGPGPLVSVDPDDNPEGHYVLKTSCGAQVVWGEGNTGTADGNYSDSVTVDSGNAQTLDNLTLAPHQTTTRSMKLGRLTEGSHTVTVVLNNGATGTSDFSVESG